MRSQSLNNLRLNKMLRKVTTALLSATLTVGIALGMTGCSVSVEPSSDLSQDAQIEQTAQTPDSAYTDATLEAEDEAVKLLSRYCSVCKEFYNSDKNGSADAESLYGIIGIKASVDYGDYPVIKPVELSFEESKAILNKAGFDNVERPLYEYDKESAYFIAENIFNLSSDYFGKLIENKIKTPSSADDSIEYGDIVAAKGSDGKDKYYVRYDADGIMDLDADITFVRTDGKKFYVKFDICDDVFRNRAYEYSKNIEIHDDSLYGTRYAVMERKEIEGKKYWTVYEISKNIPDGIFAESRSDAYSRIKGDYTTVNANSGLSVEESGRSSGNFFHTALDGVHDYQNSQYDITFSTPEKIDKYTYRAKVEKLEYKHKVGSVDDQNGIKTVYVEALDIKEGSTVYFYVKGTPFTKLLAEFNGDFNYPAGSGEPASTTNSVYIPGERACYYE